MMINLKFGHTIFLLLSPNDINPSCCRLYSRYSEAFSDAVKDFANSGCEIYRCDLVLRSLSKDPGDNYAARRAFS